MSLNIWKGENSALFFLAEVMWQKFQGTFRHASFHILIPLRVTPAAASHQTQIEVKRYRNVKPTVHEGRRDTEANASKWKWHMSAFIYCSQSLSPIYPFTQLPKGKKKNHITWVQMTASMPQPLNWEKKPIKYVNGIYLAVASSLHRLLYKRHQQPSKKGLKLCNGNPYTVSVC